MQKINYKNENDNNCIIISYFIYLFFFLKIPRPPKSTLFPYTTLFQSKKKWKNKKKKKKEKKQKKGKKKKTNKEKKKKNTQLNSSHEAKSYAILCLQKKNENKANDYNLVPDIYLLPY